MQILYAFALMMRWIGKLHKGGMILDFGFLILDF